MCQEVPYYHAGYYLIKLRPIGFGSQVSKRVFTCSICINDSLLDSWSYSWTTRNNDGIDEIKAAFQFDDERILSIREWVDNAHDSGKIGWPNVFRDLETVGEYCDRFLPKLADMHVISLYFPEPEVADLLSEFEPKKEGLGKIGLYEGLEGKVPEGALKGEDFIGFDVIGVEDGGDFHSFYCHDMSDELVEKFHLTINQYGLFNDIPDWKSVTDFIRVSGEPVPWFVCKVKLVNNKANE